MLGFFSGFMGTFTWSHGWRCILTMQINRKQKPICGEKNKKKCVNHVCDEKRFPFQLERTQKRWVRVLVDKSSFVIAAWTHQGRKGEFTLYEIIAVLPFHLEYTQEENWKTATRSVSRLRLETRPRDGDIRSSSWWGKKGKGEKRDQHDTSHWAI